MKLDDYLTIAQAAREIGITESALRKRVERGDIPSKNWLGRVLIHKKHAEAAKQ